MRFNPVDRREYVGGSDARIIMGDDEDALARLWQEKRCQAEPADLSSNLIVQLGLVIEVLNRFSASLLWRPCCRGSCQGSATWPW